MADITTPAEDALKRAAALYRDAMPEGRVRTFDVGPLDRLGLTVYLASFAGADGFVADGFGYGATAEEALVGGLGELSETTQLDHALRRAPVTIAPRPEMVGRHGAEHVLDPLEMCLPAGSEYAPDDPVAWVSVTRWPDGASGWAPLDAIACLPGQWTRVARGCRPLFRPITCGLGAGVSVEQALAHAVLELLQRDGNCTAFRAMDRGVAVDMDTVADPTVAAILERLRGAGIALQVKLASTEFDLVNLYVQGPDPSAPALAQTACGEAVDPSASRALRKAALEFVASRARKLFAHGPLEDVERVAPAGYLEDVAAILDLGAEEPRAMAEMARWLSLSGEALVAELGDSVFSEVRRVPFSDLPDERVTDHAERLALVTGRLAEHDISVWWFDASPPSGPRVVKAVAPRLEGETMSYRRIGERGAARLLAREHPLVTRPPGEGRHPIRLTTQAEARLGGPVWFDAARADAIVGGAYPLYREPSSHAVQLALRQGLLANR